MALKTKIDIKSKVNSKVIVIAILLVALISAGFVGSSLLPATTGDDDSKDINLPPPPPLCPEGKHPDNGNMVYDCLDSDEKDFDTDCAVDKSESYRCDQSGYKCCLVEESGCTPGTTQCGDACCNANQACKSSWGVKYCDNNTCPTGKKKVTCGSDRAACCNPEDSCGVSSIVGTKISVCIPPDPPGGCKEGAPGYCGKTDDGKAVCCGQGTQCKNDGDTRKIPVCVPKECKTGERLCSGDKGFAICCAGDCYRQGPDDDGNGIPDLPGCKP